MAKKKVTAMIPVTTVLGDELVMVIQDSQNKRATITQIMALLGVSTRSTTISSAQILDIHNTPIEVIPTPGSGFYTNVISVEYFHDFGGTTYTRVNSAALQLYYGPTRTTSLATTIAGAFMALAGDAVQSGGPGVVAGTLATAVDNIPVYVTTSAANGSFTTGNGTLRVRVTYQTISL